MGIHQGVPQARKMFGHRDDPAGQIAPDGGHGIGGRGFRVRAVSAVPLGARRRPGHVQDRGQVDVEAHQGQFPGHLPGQAFHLSRRAGGAQVPGRGDEGEGRLQALDPAPLLVHRQKQGPPGGR